MKELMLITGISGAGKTTASNILEDMGYTCIDQCPVELLSDLIGFIKHSNDVKYNKVVLTIHVSDLHRYYKLLANSELSVKTIILTCNKNAIIKRYKFSRRMHPLVVSNIASTVEEAYEIEVNAISKFEKEAQIIDTTNLTAKQLKSKLDKLLNIGEIENLAITFESFGYKNGIPDDADLVFDVRMLDNPFYVKRLKNSTGNSKNVSNFVLKAEGTEDYLNSLISFLDLTLKAYDKSEKRHLCICVGCTGGQHRSVTITNYLYEHYKNEYNCYLKHREVGELKKV